MILKYDSGCDRFSTSSYRRGWTQAVGEILVGVARLHDHSRKVLSSVLIRVCIKIFQWNNTQESIPHASLLLMYLKRILECSHPTMQLLNEVQVVILQELRKTRSCPPPVIETRIFMILMTVRVVVAACGDRYRVDDVLFAILKSVNVYKSLPKFLMLANGSLDSTSQSQSYQHISFCLQKIFVDDNVVENGKHPNSKSISHSIGLDISSNYHPCDHNHSNGGTSTVIATCDDKSLTKTCFDHRFHLKFAKEENTEMKMMMSCLLRDLKSWISYRRQPLSSSKLLEVVCHLIGTWGISAASTTSRIIEILFIQVKKTIATRLEDMVVCQRQRQHFRFYISPMIRIILLSCVPSPSIYIHKIIKKLIPAMSKYTSKIFQNRSTNATEIFNENYEIQSKMMKNDDKFMSEVPSKFNNDEVSLIGFKFCSHALTSLVSHFAYVSVKDIVAVVQAFIEMIEQSLHFLGNVNDSAEVTCVTNAHIRVDSGELARQVQDLKSSLTSLCSFVAYILIHRHVEIAKEIKKPKNLFLRNALMALYDNDIVQYQANEKCIKWTHPFLAVLLSEIILPQFGILCSCCQDDESNNLSVWYDDHLARQHKRFSCQDLHDLNISTIPALGLHPGNVNASQLMSSCRHPIAGLCHNNTFHDIINTGDDMIMKKVCISLMATSRRQKGDSHVNVHCQEAVNDGRKVNLVEKIMFDDVIILILSFCSYKRICRLACVNKHLSLSLCMPTLEFHHNNDVDISQSPYQTIWKMQYASKFGQIFGENKAEEGFLCQHCTAAETYALCSSNSSRYLLGNCNGSSKYHNWYFLFKVSSK